MTWKVVEGTEFVVGGYDFGPDFSGEGVELGGSTYE